MKHMIFLALVSLAATALAQEKPAAKEPAKAEAMKAATKPEARRWHEDARHCLELPSNTEIIKCAEEYL